MAEATKTKITSGYQPASFRGVAFFVATAADEYGRRGALHEFPTADKGFWDDLGGKDPRFQIEAYILSGGPGGLAGGRDALIAACRQAGPGELVHPWLGRRQVVCESCRVSHSKGEVGYVGLSLAFIEAAAAAGPRENLAAGLFSSCDQSLLTLAGDFVNGFSSSGSGAWVADWSVGCLGQGLDILDDLDIFGGRVSAELKPFLNAGLKVFNLVASPGFSLPVFLRDQLSGLAENLVFRLADQAGLGALARDIVGLIRLVSPAAGSPAAAYAAQKSLRDAGQSFTLPPGLSLGWLKRQAASEPAAPGGLSLVGFLENLGVDLGHIGSAGLSPALTRALGNLAATALLFRGSAAVEAARLVPYIPLEHKGEADQVKKELLGIFDQILESPISDELYQNLSQTQGRALAVLAQRAPSLAALGRFKLPGPWPSLKAAYDLYESLDLEADLVKRNQVRHPGFLPADRDLTYLIKR